MQSFDYFRHLIEIEGVDGVCLQMVVHVPEEGSIRYHDSPVSVMPEGVIVGKINASEKLRCRQGPHADVRVSSDSFLNERDVSA